eukprot:753945-Hanusia_phi.AAC.1
MARGAKGREKREMEGGGSSFITGRGVRERCDISAEDGKEVCVDGDYDHRPRSTSQDSILVTFHPHLNYDLLSLSLSIVEVTHQLISPCRCLSWSPPPW